MSSGPFCLSEWNSGTVAQGKSSNFCCLERLTAQNISLPRNWFNCAFTFKERWLCARYSIVKIISFVFSIQWRWASKFWKKQALYVSIPITWLIAQRLGLEVDSFFKNLIHSRFIFSVLWAMVHRKKQHEPP